MYRGTLSNRRGRGSEGRRGTGLQGEKCHIGDNPDSFTYIPATQPLFASTLYCRLFTTRETTVQRIDIYTLDSIEQAIGSDAIYTDDQNRHSGQKTLRRSHPTVRLTCRVVKGAGP